MAPAAILSAVERLRGLTSVSLEHDGGARLLVRACWHAVLCWHDAHAFFDVNLNVRRSESRLPMWPGRCFHVN